MILTVKLKQESLLEIEDVNIQVILIAVVLVMLMILQMTCVELVEFI